MGNSFKKENIVVKKTPDFDDKKTVKIEKYIKQLEKKLNLKEELDKDFDEPKDTIEQIIRKARKGVIIDDAVEEWINLSEEKIKISSDHLQTLINASLSGIVILDKRGWVTSTVY